MRVGYYIPTYNQMGWVVSKHLPSVNTKLIEYINVHYNGNEDIENQYELPTSTNGIPVIITGSSRNLGVAGSWNLFCKQSMLRNIDLAIIANDDIILHEDCIPRLVQTAVDSPMSVVAYAGDNAFSLFALPMNVYRKVGGFDENFWPAYFEDNDYVYRLKLLNVDLVLLDNKKYYHKGSSTINSYAPDRLKEHHRQFDNNEAYYKSKWGGVPGKETIVV